MAGELWRATAQIAKQTDGAIAQVPTRRVYLREPIPSDDGETRFHEFDTGTRTPVRQATADLEKAGFRAAMPLSASELIEWLLMGVQGGVTPTAPSAGVELWTFVPGNTVDAATVVVDDGARVWRAIGAEVNTLRISGNVRQETTVEIAALARGMEASALASLAERVPDFVEGWETALYLDAFGGTPGTTKIAGTLINWNIELNNNKTYKYFAENTRRAGKLPNGKLDITGSFVFEADSAQSLTEFNNWRAVTKRLARLEFGQNEVISLSVNEIQQIAITGAPVGGSFTATHGAQTTAAIPYNATAQQVQAALEALSTIGAGNVLVAGGPLPATPVTITFRGALQYTNPAVLTTTDSLTGGTTPATAVTTPTSGVAGFRKFVTLDLPLAFRTVPLGGSDEGTRTYEFTFRYVYDPTNAFGVQIRAQNARSAAWV